jgi:hypothetical protein
MNAGQKIAFVEQILVFVTWVRLDRSISRQRCARTGEECNRTCAKGKLYMKTSLSLAALALAGLLLAAPGAQAGALKLDGLHQDSLVQPTAMTKKKKKKKVVMKKKKKKVVMAKKKKKAMKRAKIKKKKK